MLTDESKPNSTVNNYSMGVATRLVDGTTETISGLVVGFLPEDGASVTINSSDKYSKDTRANIITGTFSYPVAMFLENPNITTVGKVLVILG